MRMETQGETRARNMHVMVICHLVGCSALSDVRCRNNIERVLFISASHIVGH